VPEPEVLAPRPASEPEAPAARPVPEPGAAAARLAGELTRAPTGPLALILRLVSGLALVTSGARLVGRVALAYRHPAELTLSERGLEIKHRVELLGRVLRDSATIIPLGNLSSITREIRFARLGLYAGLVALVLGTYVGTGLIVDGLRVPGGSPSLLAVGLGAIALSVGVDFVLTVLIDAVKKTCRVVVTPHHGPSLCIQGLDPEETDRVLTRIAEASSAPPATSG